VGIPQPETPAQYWCLKVLDILPDHPMTIPTATLLSSRDRILLAAKVLFSKNGYENASTVAIARQAGTSESQLMKHFGSKQGLLFAILEQGWSAVLHRAYALSSMPVRSPQVLIDVLEAYIVELQYDPEMRTLLVLESRRTRRDESGSSLGGGRQQFGSLLENILKDLNNQGVLQPDLNVTATRAALFGMVEGLLFEEVVGSSMGRPPQYLAEEGRKALETMVSGLLTESVASGERQPHATTWTHAD
jgi:AcrR family transcriptional regulator